MRFEFEINLKPVRKVREKKPAEPSLRKNLVMAHQIQILLEQNKAKSQDQIARWMGFNRARISQLMSLLFLAPEIQTEILLSKDLEIAEHQSRKISLEADWLKQKQIWLTLTNHLSVRP